MPYILFTKPIIPKNYSVLAAHLLIYPLFYAQFFCVLGGKFSKKRLFGWY